MSFDADYQLDTKGLYCPEPVMSLHNQIRKMESGETVSLVATDPSTQWDIPKFCSFLGHELVEKAEEDKVFTYLIKKG